MSKKQIAAAQIEETINAYLAALRAVYGARYEARTEVSYRHGHFWVKSATASPDTPAIPFRLHEVAQMTADLEWAVKPKSEAKSSQAEAGEVEVGK